MNAETNRVGEALHGAITSIQLWAVRNRSAKGGPSLADRWLLGRLADGGPVRMSELATWHRVDRSTMTAQIKRLAELGLVERGSDPRDARAVTVAITRSGRELADESRRREMQVLDEALSEWDSADLDALSDLLGRFAESLDRARPE